MVKRFILHVMLVTLAFNFAELRASDWKKSVDLKGTWYFTIGDDSNWAQRTVNMNDWDQINVPDEWERYYQGYNGFAWYRKSFDFNKQSAPEELVAFLGYIDDVDEVFINGVKIGQSGRFPPNIKTANNIERRYFFSKSLLKTNNNTIAVRVYDQGKPGGIIRGEKIGVYFDAEETTLLFNLSGNWKFTTQKNKNIHSPLFDDSELEELYVPASWDSQGYLEYDGYGWYRKKFTLPQNFSNQNLFLVLGKIDELDKVYLNGKLIGTTKDLEAYNSINVDDAYKLKRAYRIPAGVLKTHNLVTVEVFDKFGGGGIYEGPIGIMSEQNRNQFMKDPGVEKEINPIRIIFDYFFGNRN